MVRVGCFPQPNLFRGHDPQELNNSRPIVMICLLLDLHGLSQLHGGVQVGSCWRQSHILRALAFQPSFGCFMIRFRHSVPVAHFLHIEILSVARMCRVRDVMKVPAWSERRSESVSTHVRGNASRECLPGMPRVQGVERLCIGHDVTAHRRREACRPYRSSLSMSRSRNATRTSTAA